jgi:hypothetical protein
MPQGSEETRCRPLLVRARDAEDGEPLFLCLDDVGRPPEGEWEWAKSVEEAIEVLASGRVCELRLDNDLYPFERDGTEICEWMAEQEVWPAIVRVHSPNRKASTWMCGMLEGHGDTRIAGRPRSFCSRHAMSARVVAASSRRYPPHAMRGLRAGEAPG